MNYGLSKSAEIVLLSQFSMPKLTEFYQKNNSFKNINLGDQFFVKNIFF